jgi:ParB family chromosome partitioning protein
MKIKNIPLDLIDPPVQAHRLAMDEQQLGELADSIRDVGLLQPIAVRELTGGRYEIVAGHRRWCACKMLSLDNIPALVRDDFGKKGEAVRFAENLQRADLSPMEEAVAVTRLAEDADLDTTAIARRLNKSEAWVRGRMLLMGLADELKELVHAGKLAIDSAVALMRVDDMSHRRYLARYAVEGGASATVIKEWVNAWLIHVETGDPDAAPAPEWTPGETVVVVQMPCATCREVHDHRELRIIRVCGPCLNTIASSAQTATPTKAPG